MVGNSGEAGLDGFCTLQSQDGYGSDEVVAERHQQINGVEVAVGVVVAGVHSGLHVATVQIALARRLSDSSGY